MFLAYIIGDLTAILFCYVFGKNVEITDSLIFTLRDAFRDIVHIVYKNL
jgi:hypothetical protein